MRYMGKGIAIREAIIKYGKENFDKEIIEYVEDYPDRKCLSQREKYWIDKLNALSPNGYNLSPGKGLLTKDSIDKIKETKKKHGGYHHSEETKRKISDAHKGKTFSEEHKKHLSESSHNKTNHIIVYENGTEIETSESLDKIAKKYKTNTNTLLRHSSRRVYINGIYLKNISSDKYACCKNKPQIDTYLCRDPIRNDICSYKNLRLRAYRHKDLYKNINIKDYFIK